MYECSECGMMIGEPFWGVRGRAASQPFCSTACRHRFTVRGDGKSIKSSTATPTETDPHGLPADAPGAKLDAGKPMAGMMLDDFAPALLEVAKVSTYGAGKYSRGGWKHVEDGVARYKDAMLRHQLAAATERTDPASGLQHYAHVAWNALAILTLMQQDGGSDAQ